MKTSQQNSDTNLEAELKHIQVLRGLGIQGRARLTFELSDNMHQILLDGIKHRHPDYNEDNLMLALLKLILPNELFVQFLGERRPAI